MKNIILIGMPGAGKTTLGRRLAQELNSSFIDFDDDVLEQPGKPNVGEILAELGDDGFLDHEERETKKLHFENTVLSCSGSQPLRKEAMNHLQTLGKVIWVDIPVETIEARLNFMKVERIVGMGKMSLREILEWRKSFYEASYEYRFIYNTGGDKEDMWQAFHTFLVENSLM